MSIKELKMTATSTHDIDYLLNTLRRAHKRELGMTDDHGWTSIISVAIKIRQRDNT